MRSLRTTVALIVAITVALSVVGLAIGVWFLTRSALLGSVDSSLQSRLEAGIFLEPAEDAPPIIRPPISGQPTVLVDAVLSDGEVFEVDRESFDLPADPEDIRIAESAPGTQAYSTRIAPNGEEVRVLTVAVLLTPRIRSVICSAVSIRLMVPCGIQSVSMSSNSMTAGLVNSRERITLVASSEVVG